MTTYVADGTTLSRQNDASPQVYEAIPQLTTIGQVGVERALIDVTNLSSTLREYKKAIADGLELQCVAQYDPDNAVHAALKTDADAETARSFKVTLTDSPAQTITFNAMVTRWVVSSLEIDNVVTLEFTLKPTGSMVIA
jgi:hypothetical protein